MRETNPVVAIGCSDLHFSPKPPIARSVEEDWYGVMGRQIAQIRKLVNKHGCSVIVAGDFFDKPNNPAELVNFILQEWNFTTYAIPGQHDLPMHRYDNIKKSSYWTLVEANCIKNIAPATGLVPVTRYPATEKTDVFLYGYPWGLDVKRILPGPADDDLRIAVIHDYIWVNDKGFYGAPKEKRVKNRLSDISGYDLTIWGDNHKGFICGQIINCGSFMRRKMDEVLYKPMVVLIREDGTYERHYLDCEQDKFLDTDAIDRIVDAGLDAAEFLQEIAGIGRIGADFQSAVKEFCDKNNVAQVVRSYLSEFMEDEK